MRRELKLTIGRVLLLALTSSISAIARAESACGEPLDLATHPSAKPSRIEEDIPAAKLYEINQGRFPVMGRLVAVQASWKPRWTGPRHGKPLYGILRRARSSVGNITEFELELADGTRREFSTVSGWEGFSPKENSWIQFYPAALTTRFGDELEQRPTILASEINDGDYVLFTHKISRRRVLAAVSIIAGANGRQFSLRDYAGNTEMIENTELWEFRRISFFSQMHPQ